MDPVRIWIRIRILPSSIKKVRKTLVSTLLWLIYDFFSLKIDVNVPFVDILKALTKRPGPGLNSVVRIRGSGSVPTCHGSTLLGSVQYITYVISFLTYGCVFRHFYRKSSLIGQLTLQYRTVPLKINSVRERRGCEAWGRLETIFLHSFLSQFLTKREEFLKESWKAITFFSAANSTNFLSLEKKNYLTRETVFFLYTYLRITYLWPGFYNFFKVHC